MSNTTSIIVYRNPVEQAFWESGLIFPLICAVVVALVVGIIGMKILDALPYSSFRNSFGTNLVLLLTAIAGFGTLVYMI